MKRSFVIVFLLYQLSISSIAQEIPVSTEQQLENLTDGEQSETEDDAWLQELEEFRKNPIILNTADAEELRQLRVVSDLQIENLIAYRKLFGPLLMLYELQAVPSWDINTIKKVLPFITTGLPVSLRTEARLRFHDGEHSLLWRISQVIERSSGFNKSSNSAKYLGSPQRLLLRYRYNYKNLLQFGILGDKDAGEQFFKGSQNKGFDFNSFHLFARKIGMIQSLALGDFTVNLGQGLIQWQSMGFKKSIDVMGVKRQAAVLRPYSSAGEFYFNRGAGITIQKGKTEATAFVSVRKLSANFVGDTANHLEFISSLLNSGYHRTINEIADRNKLSQTSFGGNIKYKANVWQAGINGVYYHFALPIQKRIEPYNLYAISGKAWHNISIDYSYTHKNLHAFGEVAVDKNFHKAFVNGILLSVDPRVDLSLVHRLISPKYQAVNGNAFTENTFPTNESGIFGGVSIRPAMSWRIDGYADFFRFPWLKFNVDAPSSGKSFMVQVSYAPNRQVEIYTRYRNETKQSNSAGNITVSNFLVTIPRQSWRTQISQKLNPALTLRHRVELVWYNNKGVDKENGFLEFLDIIYKPLLKPYSGILRLQYFETSGYDSRIYAYENDILYSFSIPASAGKGLRYYLVVNYDVGKKISIWLRLAQTAYKDKSAIGSGLDEIEGNRLTEIKFQIRYTF